jgi:hypothetical protein
MPRSVVYSQAHEAGVGIQKLRAQLEQVRANDGISSREAAIIARKFFLARISAEGEVKFVGVVGDCWEFNRGDQ